MQKRHKQEIDPNIQYGDDDEQYEDGDFDNQAIDEDDDNEGGETALNGHDDDGTGYTPGNAANGFDRVQVNSNFHFPGGQNRINQAQNQQLGHGKIRPQSAKTGDDQQLKFQQQVYQNMQGNPGWVGQPVNGIQDQQYSYQMNSNLSAMIGGFTAPYAQGGFYQNIPQGGNMMVKKRPTTASRRNNVQFGMGKKSFGSKNPSTLDLEISRMRPRVIHQDRERLYDDAMKQKMAANYLKDENVKLRTKVQILESEIIKKEKLVDDLLMQQDSYQVGGPSNIKTGLTKLQGHLTVNLKRKIKDFQTELNKRNEEIESYRRNIKSTKIAEIEVELKMYMDECTRLRHQLEEVIKSKDTFADPEELKMIEDKFQQQDILINSLKNENNDLALAYSKKEDENRQLREIIGEVDKKQKQANAKTKESSKLKKVIKSQDKEINKLKIELQNQKIQNEDYRIKIEELIKKNQNNFNSRAQTSNVYNQQNSGQASQNQNYALDQECKKLKIDLTEKDNKVKELNTIVQQLQQKLQEKVNELSKESFDKQKFKDLYEKYQNQIAQMEAQLESGMPIQKQKTQKQQDTSAKEEKKPQQVQQISKPAANKSFEQQESVKKIARVDPKSLEDTLIELKLKLQIKNFYSNQLKDFFFKPYSQDSPISIKELKDKFECNGIPEKKANLLARYLIEPKNLPQVAYSEDNSASQKEIIDQLSDMIGHYKVFSDAGQIKKYNDKIQKLFTVCKGTLKDTMQLEDYVDEGVIPLSAFKEAFETLDLEVDEELMDYILYVVYQKSESLEMIKYQALFDLIEGKLIQGQLSVGSEGASRKRPESSSPEKLKARNKEKFTQGSQPTEQDKKKSRAEADGDEDDEEDNYEEEFEKLLDKDDEDEEGRERQESEGQAKHSTVKINEQEYNEDEDGDDGQQMEGEDDEYIDEEEMLDVAEKCFVRIAEAVISKGVSVRQAFNSFIIKEDLEGQVLELLSPIGFLEGIKDLGITDLEEVEVACLMRVLTKADLENAILLRELIVIMENFGIQDDEDNYDDDDQDPLQQQEATPKQESLQQPAQQQDKKKKKKAAKQMDLSQLDEKSIKILAKLMLALMELNVSLYDFFEGVIYEQLVKTKTKQNVVEIIQSKEFFEMLQKRGVRKSDKEHENLKKFLQLDPNYPQLIMLKKVAKALDEMAKNEELMAGILGAAEDDIAAAEGQIEGEEYDEDNIAQPQQQQRLITIGEDGEEDRNFETNKDNSKGALGKQRLQPVVQQEQEDEEGDGYGGNEFEEGEEDDYAF